MRATEKRTRATMADVAGRAGVSIATVSRVVNQTAPVSEEASSLVWKAVRDLGYEIDHVAKSLRVGTTHTIAVIVGDLGNPFYSDFIKGIELGAQRARLSVMVCTAPTDDEGAEREVQMLLSKRVDGVIMWGWCLRQPRIERLLSAGIPFLGIELVPQSPAGTRNLSVDFRNGMGDVLAHLVSLGHRNIGYIWDERDRPESPESRFYCFREAMREYSLTLPEESIGVAAGGQRPEIGQSVMLDLVQRAPDLTAVVCHNDLLALGVLRAAKQSGLSVPEDMSVVGVDDIFT
ncbi:MAG: LacI family transcriptional regulator, partial [Armatimonadota bacterium]|nr:LacI family transcriptional regulator [Armatimonadota bacterium]